MIITRLEGSLRFALSLGPVSAFYAEHRDRDVLRSNDPGSLFGQTHVIRSMMDCLPRFARQAQHIARTRSFSRKPFVGTSLYSGGTL